MSNVSRLLSGAALALFLSGPALAADKAPPPGAADKTAPPKDGDKAAKGGAAAAPAKAGDPTGTWKWSFTAPNGNTFERTVKLTREGEKLKGSSTGRDGAEHPIEEASFKNGEVAFKLVRERDGQKMVSNFKGKVEGDTIKGTMVSSRGGEERTTPWEAKRQK